jgi:hypothetical protein
VSWRPVRVANLPAYKYGLRLCPFPSLICHLLIAISAGSIVQYRVIDQSAMARIHLYVAAACAVVLALAAPTLAGDPDMLQDVCVADYASRKSTMTLISAKIFVTELAAAA